MKHVHWILIAFAVLMPHAAVRTSCADNTSADAEQLAVDTAVQALVESLYDDDNRVRVAAAEALTQIGKPAIPKLIDILGSEDQIARSLACQILSILRARTAVPELAGIIRGKNNPQHVRLEAIRAVGHILSTHEGFGGGRNIHVPQIQASAQVR